MVVMCKVWQSWTLVFFTCCDSGRVVWLSVGKSVPLVLWLLCVRFYTSSEWCSRQQHACQQEDQRAICSRSLLRMAWHAVIRWYICISDRLTAFVAAVQSLSQELSWVGAPTNHRSVAFAG